MTYHEKIDRVRELADILLITHGEPAAELAMNYTPAWDYRLAMVGHLHVQIGSQGYTVYMRDQFGLVYHYNHELNQHPLTTGEEEQLDAAIVELEKALVLDELAGVAGSGEVPPVYYSPPK